MIRLRKMFASATLTVGLCASPCFAMEYSKCIGAWPANGTVTWGEWQEKCSRESYAKPIFAFGMTWTGPYLVEFIEGLLRSDPDAEKHPEAFAMALKAFEPLFPKNEKAEAECFIQMTEHMSLLLQAEPQTPAHLLRGLSQIALVIENLDEGSTTCGVTRDFIRNAVLYPASSAKFQIADTARSGLYVNVGSLFFKSDDFCVSVIHVKAYSNQTVTLNFSHREAFAEVELWDKSSMVSSSRVRHSQNVTEAIESSAKQFVTEWNLDNKDEK